PHPRVVSRVLLGKASLAGAIAPPTSPHEYPDLGRAAARGRRADPPDGQRFRRFASPNRGIASASNITDVSVAEAILLVVDARDGPRQTSRRHGFVLSMRPPCCRRRERRVFPSAVLAAAAPPALAIITSVDLITASASSPRRSFSARTASAVITAVSD